MRRIGERLRALEAVAAVDARYSRPWRRLIVRDGEATEAVIAASGFDRGDNFLISRIVSPKFDTAGNIIPQTQGGGVHA